MPKPDLAEKVQLFQNADKIIHFFLFFIESILLGYYLRSKSKAFKNEKWVILLTSSGLALFTEFMQNYVPGRELDIFDAAFDMLGAISGLFIFSYVNPLLK